MRIFIGGLNHETNSFNPKYTCVEDFTITRGADLMDDPGVRPLLGEHVDIVPSFLAEAIPSGPVEAETYSYFKQSLLHALAERGPFDGVCLFLHGAMVVAGIGDGENDLLENVRALVGEDVLISISLDLHGNITPELARYANICTAYRTAPHVDMAETRKRALSLLIDSINAGWTPRTVVQKIPVMIAGDPAITSQKPALELYQRLSAIDKTEGILTSSLMIGYSWNDTPSIGSSVLITAEGDEYLDRAVEKASDLAEAFWNVRNEFRFGVPTGTIDETIDLACTCEESPVFLSDSGDNVTSGAAGDLPLFLERLVAHDVQGAIVAGIIDPDAVHVAKSMGVSSTIEAELGGKLDTIHGNPLLVSATVLSVHDIGAVIRVGGIDVILTSRRMAFTTLASFEAFGIDPTTARIVVVKLGYLFPELKAIAAQSMFAISPGFADQKLNLPYKNLPRPIFPLDPEMEWRV